MKSPQSVIASMCVRVYMPCWTISDTIVEKRTKESPKPLIITSFKTRTTRMKVRAAPKEYLCFFTPPPPDFGRTIFRSIKLVLR